MAANLQPFQTTEFEQSRDTKSNFETSQYREIAAARFSKHVATMCEFNIALSLRRHVTWLTLVRPPQTAEIFKIASCRAPR
jgi:hypothetical protein